MDTCDFSMATTTEEVESAPLSSDILIGQFKSLSSNHSMPFPSLFFGFPFTDEVPLELEFEVVTQSSPFPVDDEHVLTTTW